MTGADILRVVVISVVASGAVGLLGMLLMNRLRDRSLQAALLAVPLIAILAVVAAVLANVWAMFLSTHDSAVILLVCAVAAPVATTVAVVLGRRVMHSSEELRRALRSLGSETGPTAVPDHHASAEFAALSRELESSRERLQRSRERERALEGSRRELVAWVSHDLRTPLASLRAMSEALEDGVAEDPDAYLKQMRMTVDRLTGMVDDLFELSRLNAGVRSGPPRDVNMSEVVQEAVSATRGLSDARGVSLVLNPVKDATVRGTPAELRRVLTNLVGNSVRHSPAGGSVLVRSAVRDGTVLVEVRDRCGGIPEEHLARVFDTGWSGNPARTAGEGAGLGLAIAQGIARGHDGLIDVRNIPGGCAFRLTLPLAPPNPAAVDGNAVS
jgi:signal transduction histidine kinase